MSKSSQQRRWVDMDTGFPLLDITEEIAAAAALVSEAESGAKQPDHFDKRDVGTFWMQSIWMQSIQRKGTVP